MILINKKMTELLKSHPSIKPIKLFNFSNIYHANMLFFYLKKAVGLS